MNTTVQVKQQIKHSAQQMAAEPLELLKAAKAQIAGGELDYSQNPEDQQQLQDQQKAQQNEQLKQQVAVADNRNLEALQSEMGDIRRQKLFDKLLAQIQNGEVVPIEEFQELSHEQRDVLKAQAEAVAKQRIQQQTQQGLVEPGLKRSRKFGGFGKRKNAAEQQQTRVEMPLPPSG